MQPEPLSPSPSENIQPVRFLSTDDRIAHPTPGTALCLSGGGYRAMLFHLGSVWRLNDAGLLRGLVRVSSVSGGSITAGVLGLAWKRLQFNETNTATNLKELVIDPVRRLANETIDQGSIIKGILLPRKTIADEIADAYRRHLFGNATLQELPSDTEGPRFVINATNVQTNVLWRFSKPFMGDYRVGLIRNPKTELAVAVGASSAFPPFLSPVALTLNPADFDPTTKGDLQFAPYTSEVVLTDGGVYDNLGLETAWKAYETILVSDGGGGSSDEPRPKREWLEHVYRILNLLDTQVRSLRKRQIIGSYQLGLRQGTYWGIRTNIADYNLATAMDCPLEKTTALANTPTRLKQLDRQIQERIINWGFAVCDGTVNLSENRWKRLPLVALRRHAYPTCGGGISEIIVKLTIPAQQIIEAFPEETAPRFLLRDRDSIYGEEFRSRVAGMGIEEVITTARSPWQNPYAERLIGSIRRECLDHLMVFNERQLRRILREYFAYYNEVRPHQSLEMNAPVAREVELPAKGKIISLPQVGGLHHHYLRAA